MTKKVTNSRRIDPREQFSKKLAGRAEWFWFGYMVILAVVLVLQPEAALPAVYMGCLVTGVMIASVWAYTKNSIDEKWFYWLAEIAKAVNGGRRTDKGEDADEEVLKPEEESNG